MSSLNDNDLFAALLQQQTEKMQKARTVNTETPLNVGPRPELPQFKDGLNKLPTMRRKGLGRLDVRLRDASKDIPVQGWTPSRRPRTNTRAACNAVFWAAHTRIQSESQQAYQAAKNELYLRLGQGSASDSEIEQVIFRLSAELRAAEVTVNFAADSWFFKENHSESYSHMFERHQMTVGSGQHALRFGWATETQSGDPARRDDVEERLMFPTVAPKRGDAFGGCTTRFGQTGGFDHDMKGQHYVPLNRNFVGATRPRYAALNYTGDRNGACAGDAGQYGLSVLVWKDSLKQRATFCAGDSFFLQNDNLCTYDTMEVLLLWMSDAMLNDLADKVYFNKIPRPMTQAFIECHVYEPMRFREHLDHIRVDRRELLGHDKLTQQTIERNITKFCNHNGARWEWV